MESNYQQIRREQLKEAMRFNPDTIIDLILTLEERYCGIGSQAEDERAQQFFQNVYAGFDPLMRPGPPQNPDYLNSPDFAYFVYTVYRRLIAEST